MRGRDVVLLVAAVRKVANESAPAPACDPPQRSPRGDEERTVASPGEPERRREPACDRPSGASRGRRRLPPASHTARRRAPRRARSGLEPARVDVDAEAWRDSHGVGRSRARRRRRRGAQVRPAGRTSVARPRIVPVVDTRSAIERFLASPSLSDATRRALPLRSRPVRGLARGPRSRARPRRHARARRLHGGARPRPPAQARSCHDRP